MIASLLYGEQDCQIIGTVQYRCPSVCKNQLQCYHTHSCKVALMSSNQHDQDGDNDFWPAPHNYECNKWTPVHQIEMYHPLYLCPSSSLGTKRRRLILVRSCACGHTDQCKSALRRCIVCISVISIMRGDRVVSNFFLKKHYMTLEETLNQKAQWQKVVIHEDAKLYSMATCLNQKTRLIWSHPEKRRTSVYFFNTICSVHVERHY